MERIMKKRRATARLFCYGFKSFGKAVYSFFNYLKKRVIMKIAKATPTSPAKA
jgi:hypothetical protein